MNWIMLKKGVASVFFEYNETWTSNLYIYNTQICIKPKFILKFDLNPNLKTKNKLVFSYIDTIDIIEKGLKTITLVQITDKTIIKEVSKFLSDEWDIIIELKGECSFKVIPELNYSDLFLRKK